MYEFKITKITPVLQVIMSLPMDRMWVQTQIPIVKCIALHWVCLWIGSSW